MLTKKLKAFAIETGNTLNSGAEFVERLSKRLEVVKTDPYDVVLAICPIVSRVNTDIEAARKVFEDERPTTTPIILVVLHHTLDRDYVVPDCSRYVGDRVSFTVNGLFHEDHGLLKNCEVNTQAINQTLEKLKELQKKRSIFKNMKHISLRKMRAKPKLKVFVIESGKTLNSGQHFVQRLSYRLEEVMAVGECDIILAVCPIVSRVGTDLEAAMKVFEDKAHCPTPRPIILVVLHHTRDRDYVVPDCSRYVGDRVALIVNGLFHKAEGLLKNSDVNTRAINDTLEKLEEFQKIAQLPSNTETTKQGSKVIPPDFSRGDSVYGSASVPQLVSVESFRQLSMAVSTQGSGVSTTEENRGAAGGGETKREMLTVGQEKPSLRETVSKVIPPDFSRGDSAYGSASASQLDSLQSFRQLSMAISTQGSGVSTTEDSRGAAGDGETKREKLTPGQHKSSLNKTGIEAEDQFEDISTITFNIMERIGRGGFGSVYKGSYLGTQAAVKIIQQDPRTEDKKIANEFRIPSRLSHPNIVQMMAVAKSETEILIANAYIHGADLDDVLHGDGPVKLQEEDKLFVALDISMAVEYIHWKGIIHQDLKPANIMVAADNRKAYLTDWGLANVIEAVTNSKLVGTPMYVARECLVECDKSTTMSDMWSLGITFLEMFTDSKPWLYKTLQELRKLLQQKSTPHAMSKLQSAHQDIVLPLLEYDPESRMKVKDLVALLKKKVGLIKERGSGY